MGLLGRGVACLYGVHTCTYLMGTVGQGCSLSMGCPNLPPGDCWSGVEGIIAMSEHTF